MNEVDQTRAAYDKAAPSYDSDRYRKTVSQHQDRLEKEFLRRQIAPGGRVLEVGCGTGRITAILLEAAESVTAVDISRQMLNVLGEKLGEPGKLTVIQSDVFELLRHIKSADYDAVVCLRVLPHLRDLQMALEILRGAAVPRGQVLFDLWNEHSLLGVSRRLIGRKHRIPTFHYTYDHMLRKVGTSALEVRAQLPLWIYPPLGDIPLRRHHPSFLDRFAYSVVFDTRRID
jgi:ubiquinone/menaquinone biosynthesis C-methylase UbiE